MPTIIKPWTREIQLTPSSSMKECWVQLTHSPLSELANRHRTLSPSKSFTDRWKSWGQLTRALFSQNKKYWWHADKEIISFLNHKSQQERKQKWKWIWCSLYSWRARHHSEEVFEKQRLWLTSISSRSVASLILNLASSNSWLLELKKPLRVVSMSNR